ncbi:ribosomal protein large subunit L8 [Thermoplasma volcanium GSS1]|uniref:Large ribosomal subunit protein eL8 n=1 Tax=Thermoplasma volcanium (strain ATCC 51530 / DSM 4299 / JCM 9571 / NBRC 15438 / GSS1) TaxID=273116 RepID=RL7A_THEVO|nr:50S ribosomal protein L7Ae [Thermoplasma volcanium]Q97BK8.1 RecName: Full=Large ribosomal subunit protein eL8; AltName: Full=50S ribosomal protein L7Ae; AltName: Full=Ribosomal protein L8e [Thermoplasma volcanium GSS1]BAB59589.1 ribosomal protein large subunit L8 [Thermoplasma volcanium GSS1]
MEKSYVKFETPEDVSQKALDLVESAFRSGKIKKGTNEVIKSIERGESKLVVIAEDVNPPEVVYYLPSLCEDKKVPYVYVKKKADLGSKVGIASAASVSIVDYGKNEELYKSIVSAVEQLKK